MEQLSDYRIHDLVDDNFDDYQPNILDFSRHLRADVSLSKELFTHVSGRPDRAEYTYGGVLYCVIRWQFTDHPTMGFLMERKRCLHYVLKTGEIGPEILIEKKLFNPSSINDGSLIYRDRVQARQTIVDEVSAFIQGALMNIRGWDVGEVANAVRLVWNESLGARDDYVSLGTTGYSEYLLGTDFTDTARADLEINELHWLLTPVSSDGTTLRDYILARISS